MTNSHNYLRWITLLLLSAFLVTFIACENKNSILSVNNEKSTSGSDINTLCKGKPTNDYSYPMSQDVTFLWVNPKKGFQGGQLKVENGTTFSFDGGSLTPPAGLTEDRINLSMIVDMDTEKNEMLFTFGPSGCQFNPSAEVWFVYKDLGITAPVLYYIDHNGNYIQQDPDYIDYRGNKMLLTVNHFSRYAIGME